MSFVDLELCHTFSTFRSLTSGMRSLVLMILNKPLEALTEDIYNVIYQLVKLHIDGLFLLISTSKGISRIRRIYFGAIRVKRG